MYFITGQAGGQAPADVLGSAPTPGDATGRVNFHDTIM